MVRSMTRAYTRETPQGFEGNAASNATINKKRLHSEPLAGRASDGFRIEEC
jgi:hypothetical protein